VLKLSRKSSSSDRALCEVVAQKSDGLSAEGIRSALKALRKSEGQPERSHPNTKFDLSDEACVVAFLLHAANKGTPMNDADLIRLAESILCKAGESLSHS
jgi:hypothetical protein